MTTTMDPFAEALFSTIRIMAGRDLELGPVETVNAQDIRGDVSAAIAVKAEREISVVMTATEPAVRELVRSVAGADVGFDDPLTADTVGELLNVVVGAAQKGGGYLFSLPVVMHERGHHVPVMTASRCLKVRTRLADGEIGLYVIAGRAGALEASP